MAKSNVKDMIKAGAKIIDVRSVGEFQDESYPGAVNFHSTSSRQSWTISAQRKAPSFSIALPVRVAPKPPGFSSRQVILTL